MQGLFFFLPADYAIPSCAIRRRSGRSAAWTPEGVGGRRMLSMNPATRPASLPAACMVMSESLINRPLGMCATLHMKLDPAVL